MRLKNLPLLIILCIGSLVLISWTIEKVGSANSLHNTVKSKHLVAKHSANAMEFVYDSLQLEEKGLSHNAFEYAIEGFEKLDEEGALTNDSVLTIIDFDQPSYKKRMYVIDVKNYRMLFNTWVAHGKNTGKEMAQSFSNMNESHKSSLGFYITGQTYNGSKGYSLKLNGLEQGLNNNALRRAIVVHGASYVSQDFIDAQGYIGRSHGCPAVPEELSRPIIQTIKNGSCLFIYNKSYKPSRDFQLG